MKRRHGRDTASTDARRQADVLAALHVLANTAELPASRELYRALHAAGALTVGRAA